MTKKYKMYLKILQKPGLLGCVSKQTKRSDDGNFLNFEFLEGQFCKKKAFLCPLEEN